MTKDDIAAQIARVDEMIERCDAVSRRAIPIKPDMSLPRYKTAATKPKPHFVAATKPVEHSVAQVSWEPQERFEEIRRAGGGYRPLCTGSYGDDVDRAFDECSNAPY